MFFVAYTKDGEDAKTRPISFLYNGGPGAATIWLHMGSFAPRRVQMAEDGFQPAPPFKLEDNESSLIDVTDMVFVDAISTGYSRTATGVSSQQFHGQTGDIRAFGEFINGWLSAYNRWPSPKYLIGESYGTIRSAGLSAELQQRHGIDLNGIVLISSLLTYQTLSPSPDNDVAYASNIETFTADAWYHKKLPADLQGMTIKQVVDQSRAFAWGDYMTALTKGNALTDAEKTAMAQKLARFTGLSPQFILNANLRVTADRYRKELLRDKRLVIGRLDGRFTADRSRCGRRARGVRHLEPGAAGPLHRDVRGLREERAQMGERSALSVVGQRPAVDLRREPLHGQTEALRGTMTRNPFLKVFVAFGYYDMATVMGGSEFNFTHLAYDKQVTDRVSSGYYEAGHMIYIRPSAHKALKQDIAKFIQGSKNAPTRPTTSQQP